MHANAPTKKPKAAPAQMLYPPTAPAMASPGMTPPAVAAAAPAAASDNDADDKGKKSMAARLYPPRQP